MKQYLSPVMRIIDVNSNRAREALRVIEDYTRFVLDSKLLTQSLRRIRHNLTRLLKSLPFGVRLISARDVEEDIGRSNTPRRYQDASDVVMANFKRLEESLRVLTEYLRISHPQVVSGLEKLRFSAYQIEEGLIQILHPHKVLEQARLYVLISSDTTRRPILEVVRQVIKGGANAIQLREKRLADDKLIKLIRKIRAMTLQHRVLFIVNDRADLAYLGQADGVHLGREDMPIRQARRILGPDKIIGATTHNIKEALEAQHKGADYISVGPMFSSPTKETLPPNGFKYLDQIVQKITIPYFAIGGINNKNLPKLLRRHKTFRTGPSRGVIPAYLPTGQAGRTGRPPRMIPLKIAVSSGIISQADPLTATRRVKKMLMVIAPPQV